MVQIIGPDFRLEENQMTYENAGVRKYECPDNCPFINGNSCRFLRANDLHAVAAEMNTMFVKGEFDPAICPAFSDKIYDQSEEFWY